MRQKALLRREIRLAAGFFALLVLAAALAVGQKAFAQGETVRTQTELEELVAPIALYPDELLAIVLPASTFPLQVVEAARFLEDREADSTLEPDEDWDNSIVALLNYPEALALLNDDLDWTWSLGEAVLDEQPAVLDAVQSFRERAQLAGNLVSDDRQVVTETDGVIEIAPADPEVVYIPYYEPERVVVYQPYPVYHYYDYAYPLYYYPYPYGYSFGYTFGSPFFWGVTSAFTIGWHTHHLHIYHYRDFGHPYYRRNYYAPYYARDNVVVSVTVNNDRNVWRPDRRRITRSTEGYTADRKNGPRYSYDSRGNDRYRRGYSASSTGGGTITRGTTRTGQGSIDHRRATNAPASTGTTRSDAGTVGGRTRTNIGVGASSGSVPGRPRTRSGSGATTSGTATAPRANTASSGQVRTRTDPPTRIVGGIAGRTAPTTTGRQPVRANSGQRRVIGGAAPSNPGTGTAARARSATPRSAPAQTAPRSSSRFSGVAAPSQSTRSRSKASSPAPRQRQSQAAQRSSGSSGNSQGSSSHQRQARVSGSRGAATARRSQR